MDKNCGVILSLYLDEGENSRDEFPFLSWSPYDRVEFWGVEQFDEFFTSQFQIKWNGVAQQMHLVLEYPEKIDWEIPKLKDLEEYQLHQTNVLINVKNVKNFGLHCIVSLRFTEKVKNSESLRKKVFEKIAEILNKTYGDEINKVINWAGFNSLGAEDIVLVALANDIETFSYFINLVKGIVYFEKNQNIEIFRAVSSFTGFNDVRFNENPKADLLIRLNLKSDIQVKNVIDELIKKNIKKDDIKHLLLGKNILDVRVSSFDELLYFFHKGQLFNGSSSFYQNYIMSSRSYWIIKENIWEEKYEKIILEQDDFRFEEINNNNPPISNHMDRYPLFQFVLKEYKRLKASQNAIIWREILNVQYDVIYALLNQYEKIHDEKNMYALLKHSQNVLLHIRQATSPVAEVPYHNYAYAGSYNDVLRMYYGVISELFELGYTMARSDKQQQYNIVYSVDFESTETVHSNMYYASNVDSRFVVFHLPYEAFTDIEGTVQLLVHEVFHYIAPHNRNKRNQLLLKIWTYLIIERTINYIINDLSEDELNQIFIDMKNDEALHHFIYQRACNEIDGFDKLILNDFIENKSVTDKLNLIFQDIVQKFVWWLCEKHFNYIKKTKIAKLINSKDKANFYYYFWKQIQQILDQDKELMYRESDVKMITKAYKEAFCDISLIKVFDLNLSQYIEIFYQQVIYKRTNRDFNYEEIKNKNITSGTLERRLCMIFDIFCGYDEKSTEKFKKFHLKAKKKNQDKTGLLEFWKYCERVYFEYINYERLLRDTYVKLYEEILEYWIKQANINLIKKLQSVPKKNSSIKDYMNFITYYSQINLPKLNKEERSYENVYIVPEQRINNCSNLSVTWNKTIFSLGEYIEAIFHINKQLVENSSNFEENCWYRGICDKQHKLLPSLYRDYKEGGISICPYAYQTQLLKEAYFATHSMPDLWTKQLQGIAEHTSFLQHYGGKTTLLDFTLDMLVALHFALNPDNSEDRKNVDLCWNTPRVEIFNPSKYSYAIYTLQQGIYNEEAINYSVSPVLFDIYDNNMDSYFVSDMSQKMSIKYTEDFYRDKYLPNIKTDKYPQPVIVRHSNSRVLAQNGSFLAYDLFAKLDCRDQTFNYLDLNKIQQNFLALLPPEERESKKFLDRIYIASSAVLKIREELHLLGIDKAKVYPELAEVFKKNKN